MAMQTEKQLDGRWLVCRDFANNGKELGWSESPAQEAQEAVFPGMVQDTFEDFDTGVAWFWHSFTMEKIPSDCDAFLKMGEVEYVAEYWLNGQYLGRWDGLHIYYDVPCIDALQEGENLLAVRISVAGYEEIDGYTYVDQPYLPRAEGVPKTEGGISYPVQLVFLPKVRSGYTVVRADIHTGNVEIDLTLLNNHSKEETVCVSAVILSAVGSIVASCNEEYVLAQGATQKELLLQVASPRFWEPQEPYLYTLQLTILQGSTVLHSRNIRFGFRELIVKDGWYYLNGRRFYLASTFTADGFHPMGSLLNTAMLYKELVQLKAMGFAGLRYHNSVGRPEILDMCDEMGIMVIEGHGASWHLNKENRRLKEIFEYHLCKNAADHINHPCIVAWEMVNESHHEPERQVVRDALQALRKVDMTRIVYQGSGRWDNDMRYGSVSNPGSLTWDGYMGAEDPASEPPTAPVKGILSHPDLGEWTWYEDDLVCWQPHLGDVHIYTRMPITFRGKYALRYHGKGLKQPCFITEFGSNSFGNNLLLSRKMEQAGYIPRSLRARVNRQCGEFFLQEWERYGLEEVFPFPEDMVQAADMQAANNRRTQMDCVRANPHYNGYCLTSLSGHNATLSILDWFRDPKPYITQMITECNAPLRWCLFVEPGHIYTGKPFTVEAVLASQDALKPGTYPVCARIQSIKTGKVWEHRTQLVIDDPGEGLLPIAFPVFKETVQLDAPAGEYDLSVYLEKGGAPTGGKKTIYLSDAPCGAGKKACAVGLDEKTTAWLQSHDVLLGEEGTILVGDMPDDDAAWDALYARIENGATAVFLKPEAFLPHVEQPYKYMQHCKPKRLRLEQPGQIDFSDNWAYRIYTIMKRHPYSKDLQLGVLNDDIYDQSEPIFVYQNIQLPDEIISVAMAIPYFTKHDDEIHGQLSGITLGAYNYGKGKFVLNCYRILDELGKNPAADQLLLNFL